MLSPKLSPILRQYIIVIGATLSILSPGFSLGWGSPVLVKLMKVENSTEMILSKPITTEEGSWLVSIVSLISMFAIVLIPLANVIGRKYCIVLSCLPNIIAGLIFVFSDKFWLVLFGRGLCGVSIGLLFPIISVYSAEISDKEIRGTLCSFIQIICALGCVTMFIVGPFISYISLNVLYTCITIVSSIPSLFIPRSPYFLYSKGRIQESLQVLTMLRGSEERAKEEIEQYSLYKRENEIEISKKIYKEKTFWKAIFISLTLAILSQCSGYNSVSFYLLTVLESTETSISPGIASAVVGGIQLFGACITACIVDKFGRKMILFSSFIGIALGMCGLGTFFKIKETQEIHGILNFLPIISIIFVIFSFIAGPASILFTLAAELFDRPAKTVGTSIAILVNMLFMFLAIKYSGIITSYVGVVWSYWMYSCISMLSCLFVIIFIPETKGKSFAEIQDKLKTGKSKMSFHVVTIRS
ncbi:facilitated trehalose transporter Tret1-like [Galleria mellonella]|uniref:Facilitated trehalose transporter Tret1-like n=1 Tax=Galleria mellonella TaxID=7137 RepID=A0A6J3BZE8_GALME|nr:facilitated trehalose transporter Tret1-like [Galleria mellonella]